MKTISLKLNVPFEVNKNQYLWCKQNLKGLFAHRKDEFGKYWIKPLLFMGHKVKIEEILTKLI